MKNILNAGIAFLCMSAAATAVTYECTMTKHDRSNWVPRAVSINYDQGTGAVSVQDDISNKFVGAPVKGAVDTDNSKRTTFKWDFKTTNSYGQFTTMQYRATIMKRDNSARVTGKPLGYLNNYKSSGSCVIK